MVINKKNIAEVGYEMFDKSCKNKNYFYKMGDIVEEFCTWYNNLSHLNFLYLNLSKKQMKKMVAALMLIPIMKWEELDKLTKKEIFSEILEIIHDVKHNENIYESNDDNFSIFTSVKSDYTSYFFVNHEYNTERFKEFDV